MPITVEDGTGVSGANSYISVDDATTYFLDRANSDWSTSTGDKAAALIRATTAIDSIYRSRFPGYRTNFRDQELEWPRTNAYDAEGILIDSTEIPQEILDATCEAALRELSTAYSLQPDLARGGRIRSIRAGSVAIDYDASANPYTTYSVIDGILAKLLGAVSPYNARASRA